jgi:putative transposase
MAVLQLFGSGVPEAQWVYRRFAAEGKGKGSPWEQLRGQIYLGDDAFLDRMDRLLQGKRLDNVPRCQSHPTCLDQQTILEGVGRIYGLSVGDILSGQHSEAYQIAAWLLRRKANLPLGEVAELFGVSASRISHIQRGIEGRQPSARELEVIALFNVKQ